MCLDMMIIYICKYCIRLSILSPHLEKRADQLEKHYYRAIPK